MRLYSDSGRFAGYGVTPKAFFWIGYREKVQMGFHVAFTAPDRRSVDSFYREAIAAGGRDNGASGLRQNYHPNYYGAFVLDPDGHNVEAVCDVPPENSS